MCLRYRLRREPSPGPQPRRMCDPHVSSGGQTAISMVTLLIFHLEKFHLPVHPVIFDPTYLPHVGSFHEDEHENPVFIFMILMPRLFYGF